MALIDNLISYFKFDGDATDSNGSNDGTVNGATYTASGKINDAYVFDGVNDYVNVPAAASLDITGAISISAWVYATSLSGGYETILTKGRSHTSNGDSTCTPYILTSRAGKIRFEIRNSSDNGSIITDDDVLSTGSWHHIVATWDGTTGTDNIKLYVDNVLVKSDSQTTVSAMKTISDDLVVGYDKVRADSRFAWDGIIDEVAIWNRELSSTEVSEIYNGGDGLPFSDWVPLIVNKVVRGGKRVNSWLSLINFDALMYKVVEYSNAQLRDWGFLSPHAQIAGDFDALVVKVHDGDTITVRTDFRNFDFPIRLAGIDAPELSEGGKEAGDYLRERILGKKVHIVVDNSNRVGKYGRLIGEVLYNGLSMNDEMRSKGLVYAFGERNMFDIPPIDKLLYKSRVMPL